MCDDNRYDHVETGYQFQFWDTCGFLEIPSRRCPTEGIRRLKFTRDSRYDKFRCILDSTSGDVAVSHCHGICKEFSAAANSSDTTETTLRVKVWTFWPSVFRSICLNYVCGWIFSGIRIQSVSDLLSGTVWSGEYSDKAASILIGMYVFGTVRAPFRAKTDFIRGSFNIGNKRISSKIYIYI